MKFAAKIYATLLISTFCIGSETSAQYCNTDLTNGLASSGLTISGQDTVGCGLATNLFDNLVTTKWVTLSATGWVATDLGTAKNVTNYSLTSANDSPTRDPKNWMIEGSNDGVNWMTLDSQSNQSFASRLLTQ